MPATVIPLSEAGAWVANLGKQMPTAAKRGLFAAAQRLAQTMKQLDLPTDRGIMRSGWRAEKLENGAAVFNGVTQAVFVEYSVRPEHVKIGRAMINALTEWAKRKGLGRETKMTAGGKAPVWRTRPPADEVLRGIAWAIATNMKKRGIFKPELGGLRALEKTTRSLGPEFVRQEVTREIRREFGL